MGVEPAETGCVRGLGTSKLQGSLVLLTLVAGTPYFSPSVIVGTQRRCGPYISIRLYAVLFASHVCAQAEDDVEDQRYGVTAIEITEFGGTLIAWSFGEDATLVCTDVATAQERSSTDPPICPIMTDNRTLVLRQSLPHNH